MERHAIILHHKKHIVTLLNASIVQQDVRHARLQQFAHHAQIHQTICITLDVLVHSQLKQIAIQPHESALVVPIQIVRFVNPI